MKIKPGKRTALNRKKKLAGSKSAAHIHVNMPHIQ
jgi:hypothetical protein